MVPRGLGVGLAAPAVEQRSPAGPADCRAGAGPGLMRRWLAGVRSRRGSCDSQGGKEQAAEEQREVSCPGG